MPRFVARGPIIPDKLVQDLEEDRVVIFCGAGISMGAGLPDYTGLVRYCYEQLGVTPPKPKSPQWLWPDRMLGELEGAFDAASIRNHAVRRLSAPAKDLEMHKAILRLARLNKTDGLRLVTTNFDLYFEEAKRGLQLGIDYHSGPILPIPRNDVALSWKSIVYLHGRLSPTGPNDHLVLTSADFGRAYLTDAWAARFVARLFSDFTVLFIGYSLNDPVLRYMTDAFAAENATSVSTRFGGPAYIFVPHTGAEPDAGAYTHRNLAPIFYDQYRSHVRLKKTLIAWADARDDFLANTKRLISSIAPTSPRSLDPSAASNLLWAVAGRKGDNGHGARVFANLQPAPPIDWIDELERFEDAAVADHEAATKKARNAGLPIPGPPSRPMASLFPLRTDRQPPSLSQTAYELVTWLISHLESSDLVDNIVSKLNANRVLHPSFRDRIRRALLEQNNIPDGFARFWRIVSAEADWALGEGRHTFLNIRTALHGAGADKALIKQGLLDALQPQLRLKPTYYRLWATEEGGHREPPGRRLAEIADVEVRLKSEDTVHLAIEELTRLEGNAYWSSILLDLTNLLIHTLDLYAIAGEANSETDPSTFQRPSIQPHDQNRHRDKWTILVDQVWAGWSHLDTADPAASVRFIHLWSDIPYLTFKRLALAAVSHTPHMQPNEKLEFLLNA